jgi:lysozyme family protein
MTVDTLIDEIILREGGYVDHAADRGGPTRYGITKATLAGWRERPTTTADVKALDVAEARDIYRAMYVLRPSFDAIPEPLRSHVVDFGVNAGTHQATKTLQRTLGVTADGVMGPKTKAAIAACDPRETARRFWQERIRFYIHLVGVRPSQLAFADGWLNRCFGMWPE